MENEEGNEKDNIGQKSDTKRTKKGGRNRRLGEKKLRNKYNMEKADNKKSRKKR